MSVVCVAWGVCEERASIPAQGHRAAPSTCLRRLREGAELRSRACVHAQLALLREQRSAAGLPRAGQNAPPPGSAAVPGGRDPASSTSRPGPEDDASAGPTGGAFLARQGTMSGLRKRPPPSWARATRAPRALLGLAALGLAALLPRPAEACPSCSTAVAARERVIDDDPVRWSIVAVAPFAAMFLLSASVYRIGSPSRAPRGRARARDAQRSHEDAERSRYD